MNTYFTPTPVTCEELKKMYHRLAMEYHPDRGGSTKAMQDINAEYEELFRRLKDIHTAADGSTYTAEPTTETPDEFRDIINRLITIPEIVIELVGRWIWITGNTYPVRGELKSAGCNFASKKKAWYWHTAEDGVSRSSRQSLNEIRVKYGSAEIARTAARAAAPALE